MNEVRPISAARCQTSAGTSVSASSTASETGRISFAAKSRHSRRISSCSGVISNGRAREGGGGRHRWLAELVDEVGDRVDDARRAVGEALGLGPRW